MYKKVIGKLIVTKKNDKRTKYKIAMLGHQLHLLSSEIFDNCDIFMSIIWLGRPCACVPHTR